MALTLGSRHRARGRAERTRQLAHQCWARVTKWNLTFLKLKIKTREKSPSNEHVNISTRIYKRPLHLGSFLSFLLALGLHALHYRTFLKHEPMCRLFMYPHLTLPLPLKDEILWLINYKVNKFKFYILLKVWLKLSFRNIYIMCMCAHACGFMCMCKGASRNQKCPWLPGAGVTGAERGRWGGPALRYFGCSLSTGATDFLQESGTVLGILP